jgi:hypothetical protein
MPTTGYDEDAALIGRRRSRTRSRWFKLVMILVFVSASLSEAA